MYLIDNAINHQYYFVVGNLIFTFNIITRIQIQRRKELGNISFSVFPINVKARKKNRRKDKKLGTFVHFFYLKMFTCYRNLPMESRIRVRILWDISIFAWPTYPVPIRGSVGGSFIWALRFVQNVFQRLRYSKSHAKFEISQRMRIHGCYAHSTPHSTIMVSTTGLYHATP